MTLEVVHPTIPILMPKETKAGIPKKKSSMDLVKTFAPEIHLFLYSYCIYAFTCDGCPSTSMLTPLNSILMILR